MPCRDGNALLGRCASLVYLESFLSQLFPRHLSCILPVFTRAENIVYTPSAKLRVIRVQPDVYTVMPATHALGIVRGSDSNPDLIARIQCEMNGV